MAETVSVEAWIAPSAILFTGETVNCRIVFRNRSSEDKVISWCGAALFCHCQTVKARVKAIPHLDTTRPCIAGSGFSFSPEGDKGVCVFETLPIVLCSDYLLGAVSYEANIPAQAPGSYRGESIGYSYRFHIAAQFPDSMVKIMRFSVRILPISDLIRQATEASLDESDSQRPSVNEDFVLTFDPSILSKQTTSRTDVAGDASISAARLKLEGRDVLDGIDDAASVFADMSVSESAPVLLFSPRSDRMNSAPAADAIHPLADLTNPFLTRKPEIDRIRSATLRAIVHLTSRKKTHTYNIGSQQRRVVKLHMTKSIFRLGDDVIGCFEFFEGVRCYQISIVLECEEVIADQYRVSNAKLPCALQGTAQIFTPHMTFSSFAIPIPLTAAPEMHTDHVSVRWRLGFEFVVEATSSAGVSTTSASKTPAVSAATTHVIIQAPKDVPVEVFKWAHAITVLPANPVTLPSSFASYSAKI